MSICRCGKFIEAYRVNVLKSDKCSACAQRLAAMGMGTKKVRGAMIFENKTAPTIHIMSEDTYKEVWKPMNPRFGRGSAVHMISKPTASV
jgi:hypothetical protein